MKYAFTIVLLMLAYLLFMCDELSKKIDQVKSGMNVVYGLELKINKLLREGTCE